VQAYYKQLDYDKKTSRPRRQLIACALPAYTKRVIGTINEFSRQEAKEGFSESIEVNGLIAGRYLWVTLGRTVPDAGFAEAELFDLQTGRHVGARLQNFALSVAAAGELVTFKEYLEECAGCEDREAPKTLIATSLAGGKLGLEKAVGIESLAASEHEIYWLSGKTVKSAAVPAASSARSATATHLATTGTGASVSVVYGRRVSAAKRRCEARGTKTLYRFGGSRRVLRKPNGAILACSDTAGKLVVLNSVLSDVTATGPPTDIEPLSVNSTIAYRFPAQTANGAVTALVVLDAVTGKVIRSTLAPATITDLVAGPVNGGLGKATIAYTEGSTLTVVDSSGTHQVDAGTISELAITPSAGTPSLRFQLYWTDAGAPKARLIG
jgi:hypothetical protein